MKNKNLALSVFIQLNAQYFKISSEPRLGLQTISGSLSAGQTRLFVSRYIYFPLQLVSIVKFLKEPSWGPFNSLFFFVAWIRFSTNPFHYADDAQIYMPLNPNNPTFITSTHRRTAWWVLDVFDLLNGPFRCSSSRLVSNGHCSFVTPKLLNNLLLVIKRASWVKAF